MKKIITPLSILLIATASYAQVQSVNSDVRRINDYMRKPGGYQRLINDYKKIPDTQAQGLEKYMQLPADYQQTQTNDEHDLNDNESEAPGHNEEEIYHLGEEIYTVERVIDADTLKLTNGEEVQLIGIKVPEDEKKGQEAMEFLKNLIRGREVLLEYDVKKRDKYGRLSAYVYIEWEILYGESPPDLYLMDDIYDLFINATILKTGYATPMTIPPNVKYADLFKELYEEARKEGRGLWVKKSRKKSRREMGPPCTADLKLCPNGSYVGRIPSNCEFKKCPC